ncbi:MAG: 50S ribosomal protein L29 [Candidatus Melainabacteria bacterium]|nr:50S ribosomal protein L29 [Candidatus Melainabacteria bacterium]
MALMKLVEIRELTSGELKDQIKKSRIELVDLRMKFASRQLEDVSQIRKKRKEIARLLTIIKSKGGQK